MNWVALAARPPVTARGKPYGLDLHEHGIPAYPEYVITSVGRPAGQAEVPAPRLAPAAAPVAQTS